MARLRALSPPPGAVQAKRGAAKDVSDEEITSTESQQIMAIGSLLEKPKTDDKDVQQFRAKVTADRKRLTALLEQRRREAKETETHRRNEIASTILNALNTPNRPVQGETPTYPGTKIAENAAHATVAVFLSASEGLVTEYRRLDKMSRDMQSEDAAPVAETWNQEIQEAERQLRLGAKVARRNVVKVLGGVVDADGDEEMLDAESGQELNYEFQTSLRYLERGVKRMVKGLPDDE